MFSDKFVDLKYLESKTVRISSYVIFVCVTSVWFFFGIQRTYLESQGKRGRSQNEELDSDCVLASLDGMSLEEEKKKKPVFSFDKVDKVQSRFFSSSRHAFSCYTK